MEIVLESRVGPDPHLDENGGPQPSTGAQGCPDVWRIAGGDFAVIGIDVTNSVQKPLPSTASCGPDERIVLVPRNVLEAAARDLTS